MTGQHTKTTSFETLAVGDAMHRGVLTCPREATLGAVARMMVMYSVHCVVVFDEEREEDAEDALWGVISDLDLAAGLVEGDVESVTAGQTAATPVVTIRSDESVLRAAQLMSEHSIAHLVVVDRGSKRPVGILSTLDLARIAGEGAFR